MLTPDLESRSQTLEAFTPQTWTFLSQSSLISCGWHFADDREEFADLNPLEPGHPQDLNNDIWYDLTIFTATHGELSSLIFSSTSIPINRRIPAGTEPEEHQFSHSNPQLNCTKNSTSFATSPIYLGLPPPFLFHSLDYSALRWIRNYWLNFISRAWSWG